ncbi:hypothetical protein AB1Y20_001636 [Prymnesium parvum]|uniref:allantoinase n=1 Tax=Prymnesium parvum TaxID=97485 RepID=A0AB34KBE7_PRYPA
MNTLSPTLPRAMWRAMARICTLHAIALWVVVLALLHRLSPHKPPSSPSPGCGMPSAVFFSDQLVLPSGIHAAFVHVGDDGTIVHVAPGASLLHAAAYAAARGLRWHDFRGMIISPGLIDAHVHVSAVGGRGWEGYATATQAAAAGGVTTIIGMPLNSLPPTVSVAALQLELASSAEEGLHVDVGLWGGVVPSSLARGELPPLLADRRVLGLKAFLSPLPPAAGYEALTPPQLHAAGVAAARASVPLLVHCELMSAEEMARLQARAAADERGARRFAAFLATRPAEFERRAIEALVGVATEIESLRAHVVHLSDAGSLPMLQRAKRELRGRLSVETCPHYLFFAAEEIPDGETRLKCLPPIRSASNRELLWQALLNGTIDMLASDHSPCAPGLRHLSSGDFLGAWAGISGLQSSLQATWTPARARGVTPLELARWWSERPARLAGLHARKGSIEVGKDADLVVWEPDAAGLSDRLYTRHPGSPYAGRADLLGRVRATFVRGRQAFVDHPAELSGPSHGAACGQILQRATP